MNLNYLDHSPYEFVKIIFDIILVALLTYFMSNKPSKTELAKFLNNKKEAAKQFGVSERTVYRWMLDYGLYEKKPSYGPKLSLKKAEQIRARYQAGDSVKHIAKKHKITLAAVYRIVNNVTYREPTTDDAKVSVIYNN
jgi:transposase